jgi:hypothetical protein
MTNNQTIEQQTAVAAGAVMQQDEPVLPLARRGEPGGQVASNAFCALVLLRCVCVCVCVFLCVRRSCVLHVSVLCKRNEHLPLRPPGSACVRTFIFALICLRPGALIFPSDSLAPFEWAQVPATSSRTSSAIVRDVGVGVWGFIAECKNNATIGKQRPNIARIARSAQHILRYAFPKFRPFCILHFTICFNVWLGIDSNRSRDQR